MGHWEQGEHLFDSSGVKYSDDDYEVRFEPEAEGKKERGEEADY